MARLRPDSKAACLKCYLQKLWVFCWMVRAFSQTHPACGCNSVGEKNCTRKGLKRRLLINSRNQSAWTPFVFAPMQCFWATLLRCFLSLGLGSWRPGQLRFRCMNDIIVLLILPNSCSNHGILDDVMAIIRIEIRSNSSFSLLFWINCALNPGKCGRNIWLYWNFN